VQLKNYSVEHGDKLFVGFIKHIMVIVSNCHVADNSVSNDMHYIHSIHLIAPSSYNVITSLDSIISCVL
jgi:hypothetical protein